jgi:TetR/AcrR family transcriptional regulator, transcriptional repressor of bet genes
LTRRPFRRASEDERRNDLIQATLDCVAEMGLKGATVRKIAMKAGVTNGLIRHYFDSKDQMIQAAYRAVMTGMTTTARDAAAHDSDPRERFRQFVASSLSPPVVDARTLSLWATFISFIHVDREMAAIHRHGYLEYRDEVERLVRAVYAAEGRAAEDVEFRRLAIKINAVIDGLWLEGCLAAEIFQDDELVASGIAAVEAILGMPLSAPAARS